MTESPRSVGPLDAVQKDPDHHGVLLENEHVRVLDALLRPGEQTEIHTHVWPSALYVLSWSDFVRIVQRSRGTVSSFAATGSAR